MANSADPDQSAPIGAVCFGSTLFASILNFLSVMLGNYLQQKTSAEDNFRCIFFLALQGLIEQYEKSNLQDSRFIFLCSYVVGTQKNHLNETVLLSTQNLY